MSPTLFTAVCVAERVSATKNDHHSKNAANISTGTLRKHTIQTQLISSDCDRLWDLTKLTSDWTMLYSSKSYTTQDLTPGSLIGSTLHLFSQ